VELYLHSHILLNGVMFNSVPCTSSGCDTWLCTRTASHFYPYCTGHKYEGVSKSFRTGRLERELQMVKLSATKCSYIVILLVSLVGFAAITLCVASPRVIPKVSVHFAMDSVRKILDTLLYILYHLL
jgi:hypothetical protein